MPCPSPGYTGGHQPNHRWQNYIQSADLTVNTYWTPNSLPELVHILQRAETEGRRVHAVGAGYSFEDLAATPDWMVDLRNLKRPIGQLLDPKGDSRALTAQWRTRHLSNGPDKLFHVEAGARLYDLCQILTERNLALPTMGGAYYASPVAADGKIYCCSDRGVVCVVKAGDQFEVLARNELGERIMASPAMVENKLYVRGDKTLWAFGE